jgi:hypothetical protein
MFLRMFRVSKKRAAVVAILCAVGGVLTILILPGVAAVSVVPFAYALIYAAIWFYKYDRDRRIIYMAETARPEQQAVEPPVASPDSLRLFVPPPLDRQ